MLNLVRSKLLKERVVSRATSVLEERLGKQSEIFKAYTHPIFDLPTIPNLNINRTQDFTEKLTCAVQSLETLRNYRKLLVM